MSINPEDTQWNERLSKPDDLPDFERVIAEFQVKGNRVEEIEVIDALFDKTEQESAEPFRQILRDLAVDQDIYDHVDVLEDRKTEMLLAEEDLNTDELVEINKLELQLSWVSYIAGVLKVRKAYGDTELGEAPPYTAKEVMQANVVTARGFDQVWSSKFVNTLDRLLPNEPGLSESDPIRQCELLLSTENKNSSIVQAQRRAAEEAIRLEFDFHDITCESERPMLETYLLYATVHMLRNNQKATEIYTLGAQSILESSGHADLEEDVAQLAINSAFAAAEEY